MASARYFVLKLDGDWLVTLNGRAMARFPTRLQALDSAVVMADLMGAMHHDADVMVETTPGAPLRLAWSYGQQVKPRRGKPKPQHIQQVQQGAEAR